MYFLEIDLRINTTINFKDFKYALEKYELDFEWESGFNEFWDTKNDLGRIFENEDNKFFNHTKSVEFYEKAVEQNP